MHILQKTKAHTCNTEAQAKSQVGSANVPMEAAKPKAAAFAAKQH